MSEITQWIERSGFNGTVTVRIEQMHGRVTDDDWALAGKIAATVAEHDAPADGTGSWPPVQGLSADAFTEGATLTDRAALLRPLADEADGIAVALYDANVGLGESLAACYRILAAAYDEDSGLSAWHGQIEWLLKALRFANKPTGQNPGRHRYTASIEWLLEQDGHQVVCAECGRDAAWHNANPGEDGCYTPIASTEDTEPS